MRSYHGLAADIDRVVDRECYPRPTIMPGTTFTHVSIIANDWQALSATKTTKPDLAAAAELDSARRWEMWQDIRVGSR